MRIENKRRVKEEKKVLVNNSLRDNNSLPWVLGFGFWVLGFFGFFGFFGFWVFWVFWVLGFGFWVLGFGFWVLPDILTMDLQAH
jgi:hypothetical protein